MEIKSWELDHLIWSNVSDNACQPLQIFDKAHFNLCAIFWMLRLIIWIRSATSPKLYVSEKAHLMNGLNKKNNLLSPFFSLKVSFYHSRMILFFKIKLKNKKKRREKNNNTCSKTAKNENYRKKVAWLMFNSP